MVVIFEGEVLLKINMKIVQLIKVAHGTKSNDAQESEAGNIAPASFDFTSLRPDKCFAVEHVI